MLPSRFVLLAGLRNALGLNQARLGASFIQTDAATEMHYLWNKTYLYKDIHGQLGWCPSKDAGIPRAYVQFFLEGTYSLVGFAMLTCPGNHCLPKESKAHTVVSKERFSI